MENVMTPSVGTELKININADLGRDCHLADVDFFCVFYSNSSSREQKVEKRNMVRVDADNFIAPVDTSVIGSGSYFCKLTVYIPDLDFPDGLRTEVVRVNTGIRVKQ